MPDASSHDREGEYAEPADRDAGGELVDLLNRYEQPLYHFLLVLLGDRDVALECTQETFVRAYENLQHSKTVNGQWLYTVARNRAMDEFRHRQRILPNTRAPVSEMALVLPADSIAMSEETVAVRHILDQLSLDEREILYLHVFDRFKTAEIASMLGVRDGAVRMRLLRARQHFRQLWGDRT